MVQDVAEESRAYLSTLLPTPREWRLVKTVVLVSLVIFLALVPFAKLPLPRVWAFIPVYESALVINDLITAVLLFGQFRILRTPGLLVLACGYLFTACMATVHALTFPDLFAPGGWLGAGPQSTAWLYMFWHAGFPLFVIAYAWLKDQPRSRFSRLTRFTPLAVAGVFGLVGAFTVAATVGQDALPKIMRGNHYTPAMVYVIVSVWVFSLFALVRLWRCRVRSVLDLWVMVVVCAWLFDIALSAMLNAGRFDLGFYAGRIYGLLAASFVLLMLLLENGMLYARLAQMHQSELQKNATLMALAQRIAEGDLTVRVDPQSYMGSVGQALEEMVDSLREMNHEISGGVAVLASSATTILSGASQVASGAADSASAVTQAVITMAETKQTALIASEKAQHVSEAAQRAAQVSQLGQESVDDAVARMLHIREHMGQIAASTIKLTEHAMMIGEIIATVNDLADQSNLLAVNASIEAAKAGEQGLGFGVVAQEVRSLAQQSKQATVQVRSILNDIGKAISGAVQTAEQGAQAVESGVKQSKAAGESIRQLAESIAESAQAAAQIAVSAQQQLAGIDQLAQAMDDISASATRNAESTRETEAAAQSLHELGQTLERVMRRYKT